eukprot:CAMPEP_0183363040 /NCGR_PEP_ID=MMETSP0164_2-20130417/73029_1 /TAXON_ID=221442 /ORGANISM="Coccolithus pelagicus ssp braarudi, Strain PLY182g" /LENGTH=100 /DNA_ID=CAMNT_0025538049 /DNA_START=194 /DNA_END=496 /DNA_ORIENTATION=-
MNALSTILKLSSSSSSSSSSRSSTSMSSRTLSVSPMLEMPSLMDLCSISLLRSPSWLGSSSTDLNFNSTPKSLCSTFLSLQALSRSFLLSTSRLPSMKEV